MNVGLLVKSFHHGKQKKDTAASWIRAGPLGEHNFASKQANRPMAPLEENPSNVCRLSTRRQSRSVGDLFPGKM